MQHRDYITAHRYQTLRMEDVYSTLKIDFPGIKEMLEEILVEETEEYCNQTDEKGDVK